jgi:hypothetical protein
MAQIRRRPNRIPDRSEGRVLTALVSLWEFSLLLCAAAMLAVAALLLARAVGNSRAHRNARMRRVLLPALLAGETFASDRPKLLRKMAAKLTIELSELVRGSERDGFIAAATATGGTDELRRLLRSRSAQDRLAAAEALAMFPAFTEEVTALALSDRNPDVRLGAALALAQEGRAPPPAILVRALGIGSREHSLLAVSLMRDLAKFDPEGVEALLVDPHVPDAAKLAATDALAESGTVEHAPLVAWIAGAAGKDSELQPRIFRALGRLGHPGGHAAILAGLESPLWQVRSAAAEAAGRSALTAAAPRLGALLNDAEWWVRFRAGEALTRLGSAGRAELHRVAASSTPTAQAAAEATLAERCLR